MRRRRFLLAAGALAAAPLARGQTGDRLPVLGILSPHSQLPAKAIADNPFTNRLRALGWVEGRNLRIERAYGEGREDRLPELAATLVRKEVDVIFALGPQAAMAAASLTRRIPIVFWGVSHPVEQGLVESLSRPGRNVTGIAFSAGGTTHTKGLEALRELSPGSHRLAIVSTPSAGYSLGRDRRMHMLRIGPVAESLGWEMREFPVERTEDVEPAFAAMLDWRAQALVVGATTITFRERHRIAALANGSRLPNVYAMREFVEAGGLLSYGLELAPTHERVAHFVDRILRGANPADLPVEQPDKYELAVNLKTAAALGLTIPQSLLLRADRVIE
ncbi:MAG: ABC transporter substrate-binding protein [Betaproteobacteria bacterium]|nr:ABC transporter substrate-binding protein [Betaproteobacteria bacterium]MDH5222582.1 ABC transporter substrate-binding protein [Betaproteobacteria bacterium]MDH5350891.1 ABC transporter substrate-binding protein [Betaproteobacteria bacterium]